jgi:hypothetical protein
VLGNIVVRHSDARATNGSRLSNAVDVMADAMLIDGGVTLTWFVDFWLPIAAATIICHSGVRIGTRLVDPSK